jgi:plastocyanin
MDLVGLLGARILPARAAAVEGGEMLGGHRQTRLRIALPLVALVAMVGALAADDSRESPASATPSDKVTVVFSEGAYRPAQVRIEAGDRITFVNRDLAMNTAETPGVGFFEYDRTSLDGRNEFDIHTLVQGEAESVEFDTPGTYHYYSSLDPGMKGVVEVTEH